jgi:hypothetical protein
MSADAVPTVVGPLLGLRTWIAVGERGAERLRGPWSGARWPDGGAWLHATCDVRTDHEAPSPDCSCGVYGLHPSRRSAWRTVAVRREIGGIVECSGAVEVHAEGFRAQRGRVHALVLHPRINPHLIRRLADAYGVAVVEVRGPDALLAWCREHDIGLAPAVVEALVGRPVCEEPAPSRRLARWLSRRDGLPRRRTPA